MSFGTRLSASLTNATKLPSALTDSTDSVLGPLPVTEGSAGARRETSSVAAFVKSRTKTPTDLLESSGTRLPSVSFKADEAPIVTQAGLHNGRDPRADTIGPRVH